MSKEFGWWPPAPKPIAVKNGLTTRRKQGSIGESWWSKRFIEVLESFGLENRLARGRAYARKGQVVSLEVQRGMAHAIVQGSRARPYRVLIGVDELSTADWDQVRDAFAAKSVFLAKLLADEMPHNIEDAFSSCSLSLFPESLDDLETICSCPDSANPCKHIAAALYLLAESFDVDPFRIFEWRGRTKDDLVASLRRTNNDNVTSATDDFLDHEMDIDERMWIDIEEDDMQLEEQLENFWDLGFDLSDLRIDVKASPYPDVLLRQLQPFTHQLGDATLVDLLAPAYKAMTIRAENLASAESE